MPKLIDNRQKTETPMKKKEVMINSMFREFAEETPVVKPDPNKVQFIPVSQIKGSEENLFFDQEDYKLNKLVESIANYGLLEKILVFPVENKELNDNGIYYQVEAGNTRLKAWRIVYQMANDGSLLELITLDSDEKARGITAEDKMANIAKTYNRIPAFVYKDVEEIRNIVHKDTNLLAREIQSLEYIVNALPSNKVDDLIKAYSYLYGEDETQKLIDSNKPVKLSVNQKAEYLVKYYKEEYGRELSGSTLRKYISAYENSCKELIRAVFDRKVKIRDYLYQISKYDYETQRKLIEVYGSDEYDEIISKLDSTKKSEEPKEELIPIKEVEKLIKKYYNVCSENELEILEKNIKKDKPTANTKEVIKKLKKLQKLIVEINEMPIK